MSHDHKQRSYGSKTKLYTEAYIKRGFDVVSPGHNLTVVLSSYKVNQFLTED
jgi:hypothetical protein